METYWLNILGILGLCLLSVALVILSGASKGRADACLACGWSAG